MSEQRFAWILTAEQADEVAMKLPVTVAPTAPLVEMPAEYQTVEPASPLPWWRDRQAHRQVVDDDAETVALFKSKDDAHYVEVVTSERSAMLAEIAQLRATVARVRTVVDGLAPAVPGQDVIDVATVRDDLSEALGDADL